ncbi:hypothetical protein C8R48DRAFT_729744 [Suillus tomentosus]|nr:hypothetical protein C8R48DRAFT_729744 [Suillus tomentosus]
MALRPVLGRAWKSICSLLVAGFHARLAFVAHNDPGRCSLPEFVAEKKIRKKAGCRPRALELARV